MKRLFLISSLLVLVQFFSCEGRVTEQKQQKSSSTINQSKNQKEESTELFLLDTIQAIVYGEESTDIITKSELDRPGIDGVYRTLEDHIIERLLYQEAVKYKMLPSSEAVEKHLQTVQQEHNLTAEDLNQMFRNAGYTPEEGKEQFARLQAISTVIDFKIRSRLIVPEREIIAYYDEHPLWDESAYQLKQAVVRIPKRKDPKNFKKELEQFIKTGIGSMRISWSDLFWIKHDEIAVEWQFIKDMAVDEIRIVRETSDEIELIQLVVQRERRLRPFEERYREIAEILRRPKYEELLSEYKQGLLDVASIVYF